MATYVCAVCGKLALPTNSNLVDGGLFVHRACQMRAAPPGRHPHYCYDDDGKLDCACGLDVLDVELAEELAARYVSPEAGW